MSKERMAIMKSDWVSNFRLIGKPVLNDYSFKIDQRSEKSNWIYNSLNLGIDCGERFGRVYAELLGGYSAENQNVIYAHGKTESGADDFKTQIIVDWDDRFNEDILEAVGDMCFITVGLERTDKEKTYYKKFLSEYDAIAYIHEHLTSDMVVNVSGNLKYSMFNDNVQVHKNINSIVLSKVESTADYKATFTQSVLLDKDSASLKDIDKNKGVMYVNAKVLDYMKEYNGIEVKGQFPYNKQFEFPMDFSNEELCKKVMDKVFKVKKGIMQITFEGNLIEGGATVQATWDDVPDEIKELVAMGLYTEEEALARCSSNGNREQRMVLVRPTVKLVGEEKIPVIQKFEERYTEDELVLDCFNANNDADEDDEETKSESSDNVMSWLDNL